VCCAESAIGAGDPGMQTIFNVSGKRKRCAVNAAPTAKNNLAKDFIEFTGAM